MIDLKIAPMNENAKFCYGTIMDFLDDFDSQKAVSFVKGPVEATFFENKNNRKTFVSIESLKKHCEEITR